MGADLDKPLKSAQFRATHGTARLVIYTTTGADAEDNMGPPNSGVCMSPEASLIAVNDQANKAGRAVYPIEKIFNEQVIFTEQPRKNTIAKVVPTPYRY